MRFSSTILGAIALSTAAFAASDVPEFFLLKTQVKPGQTGKGKYNNLYMTLDESTRDRDEPILIPQKFEGASFFGLDKLDDPPKDGHSFYNLKFNSSRSYQSTGFVFYNIAEFAEWQPVLLLNPSSNMKPPKGGFWLNGTGTNIQLQWTNDLKNPSEGTFTGWLACDWWYGYPELFATFYTSFKVPSSCAKVEMLAVPLPNPS